MVDMHRSVTWYAKCPRMRLLVLVTIRSEVWAATTVAFGNAYINRPRDEFPAIPGSEDVRDVDIQKLRKRYRTPGIN